jgi:CRP-like cAMP-binding protein
MIAGSTWGRALGDDERARVMAEAFERRVPEEGYLARAGEPSEHWIGIIDGLAKMSLSSADGRITTLTGLGPGAWFGEGSVLKREIRRYDAVALRPTRIALVPCATFMWLRERSLPFNHYLQHLMNARIGLFIGMLEYDRLLDVDARVARCLASLFNPDLYPHPSNYLEVSQHEIGLLCGTSRQRTNGALQALQRAGLIRVETRGVTVLDVGGLRGYIPAT